MNAKGGKKLGLIAGILLGVGVGFCVILILSAILAKLIDAGVMSEEIIGYGMGAALILASAVGSIFSVSLINKKIALTALGTGGGLLLVLLSITALGFRGQFSGVGESALLVVCGSGLAVLISAGKGSRKSKRRRIRNW